MKKISIATTITAAIIIAAACSKEMEPDVRDFKPAVINAACEGIGTKVEIAYRYAQIWQDGDKIFVTDGKVSDSFTLCEGAGTTTGKFIQDNKVSFGTEVEAFYPSTIGTSRIWPATQTKDDTVPMYCKGTLESTEPADFEFSSLGAILQIGLNATEKNIVLKSIEIKDEEKPLSGSFSIDRDGLAVISSTDKDGITMDLGVGVPLGLVTKYFDIAVPAGNYRKLRILLTATDGSKMLLKDEHVAIERNAIGRLFLTASRFRPDGSILTGEFTVNAEGKTVVFSKGNLWYNGNDGSFNFESSQKDRPFGAFSSQHVGNFFWNTNYVEAVQTSSPSNDGSKAEDVLFTNLTIDTPNPAFTANGVTGKFRTLSSAEWSYLTGGSERRKGKFKDKVYVYNEKGDMQMYMGIAPDAYPGNMPGRFNNEEEFRNAEELGVVFFPYAGYRYNGSIYYANGGPNGGECHYWLSDPDAGNVILAHTTEGSTRSRNALAFSLRLVAD